MVTSEEYKASIFPNRSKTLELSEDVSRKRLAELHRLKHRENISPKNEEKKSLIGQKMFDYGGRLSRSVSRDKGVGNGNRVIPSASTGRMKNNGRGRKAGRSKVTTTEEDAKKTIYNASPGYQKRTTKKGGMIRTLSPMEMERVGGVKKKATASKSAAPAASKSDRRELEEENVPLMPVFMMATFHGRCLSRSSFYKTSGTLMGIVALQSLIRGCLKMHKY